jgi:hypothetical protein
MRKIKEILDDLLNREISKYKAEHEIIDIINQFRTIGSEDLKVEETGLWENTGFTWIKINYNPPGGIKKGDIVNIIKIP